MGARYLIAVIMALFIVSSAEKAHALITLDQEYTIGTSSSYFVGLAGQTFTAGVDGVLNKVLLNAYVPPGSPVYLLKAQGGVPDADLLGALATSNSMPFPVDQYTEWDVSPFNIAVKKGDVFVIAAENTVWNFGIEPFDPSLYEGGTAVERVIDMNTGDYVWEESTFGPYGKGDYNFKTYVDVNGGGDPHISAVPEPSSLSLLLLGGIGLVRRFRTKTIS